VSDSPRRCERVDSSDGEDLAQDFWNDERDKCPQHQARLTNVRKRCDFDGTLFPPLITVPAGSGNVSKDMQVNWSASLVRTRPGLG